MVLRINITNLSDVDQIYISEIAMLPLEDFSLEQWWENSRNREGYCQECGFSDAECICSK